MKLRRAEVLSAALVVVSFVSTALLYDKLPDSVPTRWSFGGVATGFTPKPLGAFLNPLMMGFFWLAFFSMRRVAPRGFGMEPFGRVYEMIEITFLGFLGVMGVARFGAFGSIRVVPIGVGALLVLLGNVMGKVTRNFFIGIRTPWTLASEEVWLRTHRFGGKVMVATGVVIVVAVLAGAPTEWLIPTVLVSLGIPAVYSYFLYRRLEGAKAG
jgi:uncharacterized membrane protein